MATRRRRRRRGTKSKLVLLLLPIALLVAVLVWLFLDEGKRFLGYKPAPRKLETRVAPKQPTPRSSERILDPERKKLDEILKNR